MDTVAVYVPAQDAPTLIDPGSGIVGTVTPDGQILADFEGNRYDAANLVTWADRVGVAAGRHAQHYPTVARRLFPAHQLILVGFYDPASGDVTLVDEPDGPGPAPDRTTPGSSAPEARDARAASERVAAWVAIDPAQLAAQLRSTDARHQMRRDILAALASPDPAARRIAAHLARQHQLDL